jgi:hypothetical protein
MVMFDVTHSERSPTMTNTKDKPAAAAMKNLLSQSPDGLRQIVSGAAHILESIRKCGAIRLLPTLPLIGRPLTGFDCRHQREHLAARPTKSHALLAIDCSPETHPSPLDRDYHLIQVPLIIWLGLSWR